MALVADDVREEMTPQQMLQYEAMQTRDPLRASVFERRVAAQVRASSEVAPRLVLVDWTGRLVAGGQSWAMSPTRCFLC